MNRTFNYTPVVSIILNVSVSVAALLYASAVFAQEAAPATPVPAVSPVAPAPDIKAEPAPLAPTPIPMPPPVQLPATAPAAATTTTVTTTPAAPVAAPAAPAAPKPVLSAAEQKRLRDEIIYRTSLGRATDVKILLDQGASANETNDAGATLLALAASRSDAQGVEIAKVLLDAGADIDKKDTRGKNALFYAAKSGNKGVVQYLLSKKIHYEAVDSAGNNARVIAYQTGNNEIVAIIDNFVLGQNAEIRKQYEEANREIARRYQEYKAKVEEQIKRETDQQNKIKLAASQTGAIQDAVHNLAYTSCSASYWEYCHTVKQETQFDAKGIVANINSQNNNANEFLNLLIKTFYVRSDIAQNIMNVSSESIKTQLGEYKSNEERQEQGIGTVEDMGRRCNLIADTWQATQKKVEGLP